MDNAKDRAKGREREYNTWGEFSECYPYYHYCAYKLVYETEQGPIDLFVPSPHHIGKIKNNIEKRLVDSFYAKDLNLEASRFLVQDQC